MASHSPLWCYEDNGDDYDDDFLTVALLAQANKALNMSDSSLFCCDTGLIRVRAIFFRSSVSLVSKARTSI